MIECYKMNSIVYGPSSAHKNAKVVLAEFVSDTPALEEIQYVFTVAEV